MIFYAILFVSFFLIFYIIRQKRAVFYSLAENSVGLVNQLISDVEEDEKLKLVQKNTNKLVGSLLMMFVVLIGAFAIGAVPVVLYGWFSETASDQMDFSSFYAILAISAGATLPFFLPLKGKVKSAYSELSQLLHRLALNNYNIGNKLFRQETKKIKKRNLETRNEFVIISGLARAGTTSLMNDLSVIPEFVSLNYSNMPFLMCPNYWAKIYKPKNKELRERSHKDGIMIGLESAEALEEYFFKVKADDSYIQESSLTEYQVSESDYKDYLDYQTIIKLDDQKIYLAKNNNFLLRYESVRDLNDDFVMVILYRDPLTHAASLLSKHLDYLEQQKNDPFVLEYMNWLGHHEFGKNQKPFRFTNSSDFPDNDKTSLDYWLNSWINYYSKALTIKHPNTILVNYDDYCKDPSGVLGLILRKAGLDKDLPDYKPFSNKRKVDYQFSQKVFDQANEIYTLLNQNNGTAN